MKKTPKIAINGFGRIGRTAFKVAMMLGQPITAINDLTDTRTLAHLLKYDTTYGELDHDIGYDAKHIIIDGKKIPTYAERDPKKLPWKKHKIDIVLECTGVFRTEKDAKQHIKAGAKQVIISAPAKDGNVKPKLLGVNADSFKKGETVIDNASCTTNCIAPVIAIMNDHFGVEKAMMTTVHAYTADQNIQDGPHRDLRRARAAAANIVPTTTGAAIATTKAITELSGKFDGMAIRVPVLVGSLSDFTMLLKQNTTVEEINDVFRKAAKNVRYKGIVDVTDEPVVSSDIIGNPHSSIVDLGMTKVVDGNMVKVMAWYDNEWGYSNRLIELAIEVAKKL